MTKNRTPSDDLRKLSVRVDQDRYVWLKTHGAKTRLSTQDILTQALDRYRKMAEAKGYPR